MLKLLFDEHISPAVAKGLRRRYSKLTAYALTEWESGSFRGEPDHLILLEAAVQKLTLVTFDQKTIRPLLSDWVNEGRSHRGVIFVEEKSIAPDDIGTLVRALSILIDVCMDEDWINRVVFLQP